MGATFLKCVPWNTSFSNIPWEKRYSVQVNIGKPSHSITVLKFTLHIHILNGLRVNSLNGLAGAKLLVQLCSFRHYLSILNFRNFTVSGIY